MHIESPMFKSCCLCIPLRCGLIGWGYMRLILDMLALMNIITVSAWDVTEHLQWDNLMIYMSIITLSIIDTVFTSILVVAGHKKSAKLMLIAFLYNAVFLILALFLGTWVAYFMVMTHFEPATQLATAICAIVILVQLYVTLLIRSEEVKLRNQVLKMLFVNDEDESDVPCVCALEKI